MIAKNMNRISHRATKLRMTGRLELYSMSINTESHANQDYAYIAVLNNLFKLSARCTSLKAIATMNNFCSVVKIPWFGENRTTSVVTKLPKPTIASKTFQPLARKLYHPSP